MALSQNDIFTLGKAYGSFSVSEINQAVHLLLPVKDSAGVEWNTHFKPLINDFHKIFKAQHERVALIREGYTFKDDWSASTACMGAIEHFLRDNEVEVAAHWLEEYAQSFSPLFVKEA